MDVRIESNIGLDIMQVDCVQNLLFKMNYTYPNAPLLHIKCHPVEDNLALTSISLMLFDEEGTERVWGEERDVHVLLTRLLNIMINKKSAQPIYELPPIRNMDSGYSQAG